MRITNMQIGRRKMGLIQNIASQEIEILGIKIEKI